MSENLSVQSYNDPERALDYNDKTGFDPARKTEMLHVTLDCIIDLTKSGDHVLELGAGSGLFTRQLIQTKHFEKIYVTDGANRMLKLAQDNLQSENTTLQFETLNFTKKNWLKHMNQLVLQWLQVRWHYTMHKTNKYYFRKYSMY